jgi:hypothetical protein
MANFGIGKALSEPDKDDPLTQDMSSRLSQFAASKPETRINVAEVDAAAARHGFSSREPGTQLAAPPSSGRGRRKVAKEPTRDLSFRLGYSEMDRFQAFADQHKLTYQKAVVMLLDIANVVAYSQRHGLTYKEAEERIENSVTALR